MLPCGERFEGEPVRLIRMCEGIGFLKPCRPAVALRVDESSLGLGDASGDLAGDRAFNKATGD